MEQAFRLKPEGQFEPSNPIGMALRWKTEGQSQGNIELIFADLLESDHSQGEELNMTLDFRLNKFGIKNNEWPEATWSNQPMYNSQKTNIRFAYLQIYMHIKASKQVNIP